MVRLRGAQGHAADVIGKLRDATVAATQTAEVQKSLDVEGAVIIASTPEEFGTFMQGEFKRWAELIAKPASPPIERHASTARRTGEGQAMTVMEKPRDVVGGLLMLGIGAGFLLFGRELPVGTSFRMGPGYFPTILSCADGGLGRRWRAGLAQPHQEDAFGTCRGAGSSGPRRHGGPFGLALRGLGLAQSWCVVVFATAWASRYASLEARCRWPWASPYSARSCSSRAWACPYRCSGPGCSPTHWSPHTTAARIARRDARTAPAQ